MGSLSDFVTDPASAKAVEVRPSTIGGYGGEDPAFPEISEKKVLVAVGHRDSLTLARWSMGENNPKYKAKDEAEELVARESYQERVDVISDILSEISVDERLPDKVYGLKKSEIKINPEEDKIVAKRANQKS